MSSSCEKDNDQLGCIKVLEFIEHLKDS